MSATINFGSCGNKYVKIDNPNNVYMIRCTTDLFRPDLDWDTLGASILQSPARDIYVGACSDGSEAISLKMLLENRLAGLESRKFNITAFDIAKEHIAMAKCGIISLYQGTNIPCHEDTVAIKHVGEDVFRKNLEKIPGSDFIAKDLWNGDRGKCSLFKMTQSLRDNVKFCVDDIMSFSRQTFQDPIVLMFRNAIPYLKSEMQEELVNNMANFPKGSLVVIGGLERKGRYDEELLEKGLNRVGNCVFRI